MSRLHLSCASMLMLAALWNLTTSRPATADRAARRVPGLPAQAKKWETCPRSGPLSGVPIENFGVVSPGCLYRSAQPGKGDFEWLAQQGFRSVINLRKERDYGAERLEALGLKYLYLPIPDYKIPTDEQARVFLEFIRNPDHWPALVHCAGGQGRAGIMSALARYAMTGWSMSDALREAREYRPLKFRMYGQQRRWLNRWKDRFPAGQYHPARMLPPWPPVAAGKAGNGEAVGAD